MENTLNEAIILIVDDIPENIDILNEVLKEYKKQVAINGETALKIINSQNPPDLILLDVMMPGLSGFEVCEKIKANVKTKDIPVIFMTALSDVKDKVKGLKLGAVDYITKPIQPEEVIARVNTHLALHFMRKELENMNEVLEQKVRDRTAELQIANKQLQTLSTAKSRFLNLISHEMRTPLFGMMGFTEILAEELKSSKYEEYVLMLKDSVDRMEKFSTKALFIAQLQTKGDSYKLEDINIKDIIEEECEKIHKNEKKKVIININIADDFVVNANYELLTTCITSLLDNAIKYSPSGGEIHIKSHQQDEKYLIEIIDQGEGFSEDAINYVFNFFAVGDAPVDQNYGLGLATVKLIMDIHSGKIEIENDKLDKGAIVRLIFYK